MRSLFKFRIWFNAPVPLIRYRTAILLTLIIAAWFWLRLDGMSARSLWLDEIKTIQAAELAPGPLIAERAANGHLPLYFLFMHFYAMAAGLSHIALRLPSLIGSLLTLLAVIAIARRIVGRHTGWWLAPVLFMALNSFDIYNAQLVRQYALLTAAAGWSAWIMLILLTESNRSPRWAILYAALNLAGLLLHPTYLLLVIVQLVILLVVRTRAGSARNWNALAGVQIGLVVAGCAAMAALASVQQAVDDAGDASLPDIDRLIRRAGMTFFGLFDNTGKKSLFKYVTILALAAIPILELWFGKREGRTMRRLAGVILLTWFYGCMAMLLAGALATDKIIAADRYFSIMLPIAPILLAIPLTRIRPLWGRYAFTIVCAALLIWSAAATRQEPGDGLMEAIHHMRDHWQPGDAAAVCSCYTNPAAVRYYTNGAIDPECGESAAQSIEAAEQFFIEHPAPRLWVMLYHCKGDGLEDYLDKAGEEHTAKSWAKVKLYLYTKKTDERQLHLNDTTDFTD